MLPNRRVVVTGLGAVTPLGNDVDSTWSSACAGQSGIDSISKFDASDYSTQIAGEVKNFEPKDWVEGREARLMDPFIPFACAAAGMAIEDAGLDEGINRERIGVSIGSSVGGYTFLCAQHKALLEKGPRLTSPMLIPYIIPDMASGYVSIKHRFKGPNHCIVSACATAASSIGESFLSIKYGIAEAMVAGGTDAGVNPLVLAGFAAARALSTANDEPSRASKPFDQKRDGFVLAEGAAVLVLEELEHARARGAKIYAELVGYGSCADAHHITLPDPDGSGAARCMEMALSQAGLAPKDVSYINAHGTSTPMNDRHETAAIRQVFGSSADSIPVSSTKSMTGHLLGAAGSIEAIFCLLAMRDSIIPPTINLESPDPYCDLDYVPNRARRAPVDVALTNSFGFGGHDVSLIFKKYAD